MELEYALVDNPLTSDSSDLRAVVQNLNKYGEEDLIKEIMSSNTSVSEAEVRAVFTAIKQTVAKLIANGCSITTDLFYVAPSIKGVFHTRDDSVDNKERKVHVNLRAGSLIRDAVKEIKTKKLPMVITGAHIVEIHDIASNSINDKLTPSKNGTVRGVKLKIAGTDQSVGINFVNAATNASTRVPPADIVINLPSELVFIIPALPSGQYRLQIVTQYNGSSRPLKHPRTDTFDPILTVS